VLDRCYVEVPDAYYQKRLADRLHCKLDIDRTGHIRGYKKIARPAPAEPEPSDFRPPASHFGFQRLQHDDTSEHLNTSFIEEEEDEEQNAEDEGNAETSGLRDLNEMLDDDQMSMTSDADRLFDDEAEEMEELLLEENFEDDLQVTARTQPSTSGQTTSSEPQPGPSRIEMTAVTPAQTRKSNNFVLTPSAISSEDEEEALLIQEMIDGINAEELPVEEKADKYRMPLECRVKLIFNRAFPLAQLYNGIPEYVRVNKIPDVMKHLNWILSGGHDPKARK